MGAPSGPIHRRNFVSIPEIVQLGDFGRRGAPDVYTVRKSDNEIILVGPVHQVQVVVVFEGRCIQHFEGNLRNLTLLGLWHDYTVLVKATEWRLAPAKKV